MNNSTKALYDMAERMLKGHIDVDEVVTMSGLPKEEIEKMKEALESENSEANYLKKLDFKDFDIGPILTDND